MKKLILICLVAISLYGCNDTSSGEWIVKDKVYQYKDFMTSKVALRDFESKYGDKYKIINYDGEADRIICEKIK